MALIFNNDVSPEAIHKAVKAYHWAEKRGWVHNDKLTVIDFTKPSYMNRMWVLDMHNNRVIMRLPVSQGRGSGMVYATRFSNAMNSHETSLGTYITLNTYQGSYGYSLKLKGLEPGINNNAYRRAIIVHPDNLYSPRFFSYFHRAPLSYGCFSVSPQNAKSLINTIKNGSVIFAYARPENHDRYF